MHLKIPTQTMFFYNFAKFCPLNELFFVLIKEAKHILPCFKKVKKMSTMLRCVPQSFITSYEAICLKLAETQVSKILA